MTDHTILWHDYETSGRDSRRDRPLQFAAIRTDESLREIEDPIVVRAALPPEVLPDPEACLVTRVVPGDYADEEVSELTFARVIAECMNVPGTCVTGYNSIRFDDEFTRFMLWRCLLPVYDREWKNGNSRWDLIDVLRTTYALRPDDFEWPRREDGHPTFRLEKLAEANGIAHASAHDAVADVRMTIQLARLVQERKAKLFDYLYSGRTKTASLARLRKLGGVDEDPRPIVHVSGRFGADIACTSVVVPLTVRPDMASQFVCIDLRHDPEILLSRPPEEVRELLYTPREERTDETPRIGIKTLHANHAPVIAPLTVLDDGAWDRVQLDAAEIATRHRWVLDHREELAPIVQFLVERDGHGDPDPDAALYDGFVPRSDERHCREVHRVEPQEWRLLEAKFEDDRLRELLFRLRCREAPDSLDSADRERWRDHLRLLLTTPLDDSTSRLDIVRTELARLREERSDDADSLAILNRVESLIDHRAADLE